MASIVEPLKAALKSEGLTISDFMTFMSDKNSLVMIDTEDREVLPVKVEQFGKESVLVTLEGKVVGRQVAFRNHEYYFGDPPERTRGFRVTLIPDR